MADTRRTMTLKLTDREMSVVESLAQKKDLSKTAVIRQALKLYELLDARLAQGDKLYMEDEAAGKKAELMVL